MSRAHDGGQAKHRHPSEYSDYGHNESESSEEDRLIFTAYAAPRGTYRCHMVTRIVIAVLALLAVVFVCVSYGVALARVRILTQRYRDSYFDVYMWTLKGQDARSATARPIDFGNYGSAWVNGKTRVLAILALITALGSLVVAVVFAGCLCCQQHARRRDDVERDRDVQQDRRELDRLRLQEQEEADNQAQESRHNDDDTAARGGSGKRKASGGAEPPKRRHAFKSCMKPGTHYANRENGRRQTNYALGVALFALFFLTFLFALVAFILCAVWVTGTEDGSLVDELGKVFDDARIDIDDDDLEDDSDKSLSAGFYMLLIAFLAALAGLVLTVIPAIAGWAFCGPDPVEPDMYGRERGGKKEASRPGSYRARRRDDDEGDDGEEMGRRYNNASSAYGDNGGGGAAYYPREDHQPPMQQAVRGIPVALPGPPVNTLNIADDDNGHRTGQRSGGDGNSDFNANSHEKPRKSTESGYAQNFFPANGNGRSGGGGGGKSAA